MQKRRGTLKIACHAGIGAFFAFLLTSALFAAPFVATQLDFAHTHPEGTPSHVHGLTSVLGYTSLTPAVTAVVLSFTVTFLLAVSYASVVLTVLRNPAHGVRAPPFA